MRKSTRFIQLYMLVVLLVAAFALPGLTQAKLLCRADPVVILSNGVTMDISATISTLPMQVQEVHYELHVPVGLTMIAVVHTPTWLTSQETFTFYADQQPGQYKVVTTVQTSVGDASVVADTTLVSLLGIRLGYFKVSGFERNPLTLLFQT